MARLSRYLLRLFWSEAMALFAVAIVLLFLIQCLRLFDVVASKGQSLLTLVGQALLGMPGLALVFLYVCIAIGLGRALRNLQGNSELQIIHANGLVPNLLRAVGLYIAGAVVVVLLLSNFADPLGVKANNQWLASIAADLVSRGMIPHKFADVSNGITMLIGARDSQGNITDFFADDQRDPLSRRSYFAKSAIITQDQQGYVLRMRDGAVQYMTEAKRFSQVAFEQYDLPLDSLTGPAGAVDDISQSTSFELVGDALQTGTWSNDVVRALLKRFGEGLRVVAVCLFVTGLAIFPTGRRRRAEVPIELTVLGAAFVERAFTAYVSGPGILGVAAGSVVLLVVSLMILAVRLRVFRPAGFRRASA